MADQLENLQRLQTLDGELYRLRRTRQDKPRELDAVRAQVAAQEAQFGTLEERLKALQLQQKEKELELQTREANVKKLQGQLFQVKTNKEYTAMQHEIDILKADASLLEEAILKLLDAVDQASRERKVQQQQVAQEQQRLEQETARTQQDVAAIEEQIAQLERQRQEVTPDVPPPALSVYERILSNRDGLALVPMVNESCGGCNRRLPPQVINEVYLNTRLVMCEQCNRILYKERS